MARNKMVLALGIGYLCMNLPNVKRTNIKNELVKDYLDNEYRDILIIITDKNIYDNIMVARITSKDSSIKLIGIKNKLSIQKKNIRDIFNYNGEIEGINKINEVLGISICQYIKIDYLCLKEVVDSINGIEVKLNKKDKISMGIEDNYDNHRLNGQQIIKYMKYNNINGATKKSYRRKIVIKKLIDELTDKQPKDFINVISKIIPSIETTMSIKEILALGFSVSKIGIDNIEKRVIPSKIYLEEIRKKNLDIYDIENYRSNLEEFLGC